MVAEGRPGTRSGECFQRAVKDAGFHSWSFCRIPTFPPPSLPLAALCEPLPPRAGTSASRFTKLRRPSESATRTRCVSADFSVDTENHDFLTSLPLFPPGD